MDLQKVTTRFNRITNSVIEEKKESFKGYILNKMIENPDYLHTLDYITMYIKESVETSPEEAAAHFMKGMLYLERRELSEIAKIVATYSIKGAEFLKYLNRKLDLDSDQARKMHDFIRTTERTNELIEKGYDENTAKHFAESLTDLLVIDGKDEVAICRIEKHSADGVTLDGEEVVYQELINKYNGKNYFVVFFVKGNSYLRYIGEMNGSIVHVINENGSFEEIQKKEFRIVPVELEKEHEVYSKNPYQIPESDPNAKKLVVNHELLMSVYNEINELAEFDGKVFKAEEILNKKLKTYELK